MSIDCKHGYLARACDRCEMEQEIAELRESHKALHRRCQQAEAALVNYRKLTAIPPDGDGVRFVSGNMGRAMLVWLCDEGTREIEALRHDIERQQTACSEHLEEIEKLRAFVRAWDAWRETLSASPWGVDSRRNFEALLAARHAVGPCY